jgi:hypothetical protein
MDRQTTALNDVPTLKLAKVGKDRERKRGGAGWLNSGRSASGFGSLGASGAGGFGGMSGLFSGMSLAKAVAILLVCGAMGAGAWTLGRMFSSGGTPAASKKIFADKGSQKYSDMSDVVKADNSIPNSLGYVSGSLDGMTPEERAKKAAADAAAAQAAADAEAKKKAEDDAAAAKATADKAPADQTAGNAVGGVTGPAVNSNPFSGRFGNLSNGLSGGAGLSGGIGGSFGSNSGGGAFGNKGTNGNIGAFSTVAKAGTSHAAPHAISSAKGTNAAFNQLKQTAATHAATAATGDAASAAASQPFDGANAGQGTSIDGPGVGAGTTAGSGVGGANNSGGSPTNSGGSTCADGQGVDSSGNCQNISTPTGTNATPYQGLINMVEALMALVAILSVAALALSKTIISKGIEMMVLGVIGTLGLVIAGIGAMIATSYGQTKIGGIIAAVGLVTMGIAAYGMYNDYQLAEGIDTPELIVLAAGTLIASAAGALAASSMKASSVATQ